MLLLSFLVQVLHFQNCYVLFPGSKSLTQRKGCGQRSVSHPLIDNYATSDVAMLVREEGGGREGEREGGREGGKEGGGGWAGGCLACHSGNETSIEGILCIFQTKETFILRTTPMQSFLFREVAMYLIVPSGNL